MAIALLHGVIKRAPQLGPHPKIVVGIPTRSLGRRRPGRTKCSRNGAFLRSLSCAHVADSKDLVGFPLLMAVPEMQVPLVSLVSLV